MKWITFLELPNIHMKSRVFFVGNSVPGSKVSIPIEIDGLTCSVGGIEPGVEVDGSRDGLDVAILKVGIVIENKQTRFHEIA
jgi:hypothetical protein